MDFFSVLTRFLLHMRKKNSHNLLQGMKQYQLPNQQVGNNYYTNSTKSYK
jgi:hypothetical protein